MASKESFEDVMLEMAWRNYEEVNQLTRDVDSKGNIAIAIVSLLITLNLALLLGFMDILNVYVKALFVISAIILVISLLYAIGAIMPRKFVVMDTKQSIDTFVDGPLIRSKRSIVATLGRFQNENTISNDQKIKYLEKSLGCLIVILFV